MNRANVVTPSGQMPWIFLSYRRGESGHWVAARISSELETYCGKDSVFYDSKSLQAGVEWDTVIRNVLAQCSVLIVLIEKNWPVVKLHEPEDWVRREIQEALEQKRLVIPLCIDGANVPKAESLPSEICGLIRQQGYFVDSRSEQVFKASMSAIAEELRNIFSSEIVLVREKEWWWDRMEINKWSFFEGERLLFMLEGTATSTSTIIPSGIHRLRVRWSESARDYGGGQGRVNGRSSYGETELLEVALWPGRHVYTLIEEEDRRSWWRRFFSSIGNVDKQPRSLTLISFQKSF